MTHDLSRRDLLQNAGKFTLAATGAYMGINILKTPFAQAKEILEVPGAIKAAPDPAIDSAWNVWINRFSDDHYQLTTGETVLRILRLRSGDTTHRRISQNTPKVSHAYWLMVTKLGQYSNAEEYCKDNVSLREFAFACGSFYVKNYSRAAKHYANGIFTASAIGAKEMESAYEKARIFTSAQLREKELMLAQEVMKFDKTNANPKNTEINSMEYKMLSFYWNLGFFILADYNNGNKDDSLILRNTENCSYIQIGRKFQFHTANNQLT